MTPAQDVEIDQRFAKLEQAVNKLSEATDNNSTEIRTLANLHSAQALALQNNTQITLSVQEKVDSLDRDTRPVVDAVRTMHNAIVFAGQMGDFIYKWGRRIWRGFIGAAAIVAGYSVYVHSASINEAIWVVLRTIFGH